jgi:hypothetical protein
MERGGREDGDTEEKLDLVGFHINKNKRKRRVSCRCEGLVATHRCSPVLTRDKY